MTYSCFRDDNKDDIITVARATRNNINADIGYGCYSIEETALNKKISKLSLQENMVYHFCKISNPLPI